MSNAFWDQRFADLVFAYGERPNQWLQTVLAELPPGRLLLPGEGEGRNAVHAATLGWRVQAVDYSEQGRRKALQLARRHGVNVDYRVEDLADFEPEEGGYDAVALIFVHLPPTIRGAVHRRLCRSLRPGGRLILEAFPVSQLRRDSGGPRHAELLYDEEMLREDFSSLRIERLESVTLPLDEGAHHQGDADLLRLLARRRISAE